MNRFAMVGFGAALLSVAGCVAAPSPLPPLTYVAPPSIFDLSERLEIGSTSQSEAVALFGRYNSESRLFDGTTLLQWTSQAGREVEVVSVLFDKNGIMKSLVSRSRTTF